MSEIYLIIGASSDVGVELIKHLNHSEKKIKIVAHYNSTFNILSQIHAENRNEIITLKCNLMDDVSVRNFVEEIKQIGIPNYIVHLPAPKLDYIKFKDLKWEHCLNDIEIQVGSAFKILQEFLPKMIKGDAMSKVVFMLSENTVNAPAKFTSKYTMSKYMLLGLLKSLTSEYAGKKVNINALSPSMIDTKLLSNIDRRMLEVSGVTDNMLSPSEIVPYIMSLLSTDSNEMYGENIYITGRKKFEKE